MKSFATALVSCYAVCSIFMFSSFAAADPIKGFEDPALLENVMAGKIVQNEMVSTATEFRTVVKAFFKKVSPEGYAGLATDHAKYSTLFADMGVKDSRRLKENVEKTEFDYLLDVVIKMGPLEKHVQPELHQIVALGKDAISEAIITEKVTNYKDQIKYSQQTTRLIPYEGGILVEDDIHFVLDKSSSGGGLLKKQLQKIFNQYTQTLRKELDG